MKLVTGKIIERALGDGGWGGIHYFRSPRVLGEATVNNFYCAYFGSELLRAKTVNVKPVFNLPSLQTPPVLPPLCLCCGLT